MGCLDKHAFEEAMFFWFVLDSETGFFICNVNMPLKKNVPWHFLYESSFL